MEFQYYLPVNLVFGRGKSNLIGEKAAQLGKRALLVTGGRSTKESGLLKKTEELLNQSGVSWVLFDKVTPNPLTTTIYEGAKLATEERCDLVVALGGGSSLDAAKGIAFQTLNGGDINDYIYGRKSSDKALPIVAVPTTCGTGSEGNGFAVMTNPDTLDKKSLRCGAIVPACSILDPLLMMTMPKTVLASVGFDALCHNMDAYLSAIAQPLTDQMALQGARLAAESLPRLYQNAQDLESWDQLCLASTLGGMVIHTAGVTALHGMEHPVSGLKNVVHGKGLAALAPYVYGASMKGEPDKFSHLSKILGGKDEHDFTDQLNKLQKEIQLIETLGDLGVKENDLDWLTENCLKVSAKSMENHPVVFSTQEIRNLYKHAL
ncbi:iron-containing alcohol dehydrogenase [Clostridium sp. E02]|uniref:iron-containing alcohol dehydrogenase n=1 Tax=Clostridium sp. E02 TaxID=2487134 RepID=UPI000F52C1B7|nr:iron-containing alcohol dehydrogenase [Clostridium sp. E02]